MKIKQFKKAITQFNFFTVVIAAGGILTLASCNSNQKPEDTKTKEVASEQNEAKFNKTQEQDASFLVDAAEINLEEIQLGRLAQEMSTSDHVKELGKMMEDDHSKALKDLQDLAARKQVTIPTALTDNGKDAYTKLESKRGKDFDKDFCDMMVKGHKAAIDKFEKESTDATDLDIRNWASSMLPALRNHLDHAMVCQKKCEKS